MATATPQHGSLCRVYANAFDLTAFMRNVETKESFNVVDATGFGATGSAHVVDPRAQGSINADGMFVSSSPLATPAVTGGTVHDMMTAAIGQADSFIAHVITDIVGGSAGIMYGTVDDYKVENKTQDVVGASLTSQSNVGIDWCEVLHPVLNTVETAAGSSTYVDDGAAAPTGTGGVAYLMVLSETGTSITPNLQSCATAGGVYVDVTAGAFSAVATPVTGGVAFCQRLVIPSSSTINRYVKCAWTGTFNPCAFLMLFARNPS